MSSERLRELNSHLMLFYTDIKRTAADVAESYVADIETKRRQLRIMKDLVDESMVLLNSAGELTGFGELLHEAWQAKQSLSSWVTNREVDHMYEAARNAGATGGKITGAGGGGFLLLFVPPERHESVRQALNKLIHVPFSFDYNGSQIVYFQHEEDFSNIEIERNQLNIKSFRELSELNQ